MTPLAIVLMLTAFLLDPSAVSAQRARSGAAPSSTGVWKSPGSNQQAPYVQGTRTYIPPAVGYVRPGSVFVYTTYPRYRLPVYTFGYSPYRRYSNWFFAGFPSVVISTPYYYAGPTAYAPATAAAPLTDGRVRGEGQWAPYDPTPQDVVERLLTMADVKKGDVVYDLGAGDGRIVIAAAKKYGVKAVGFEIDPGLVKLARENVRKQGLEKLVEIRQEDFSSADLSGATVVTLYLSYDGNQALRSRLTNQLKPGARVVSYTFDMGDWPAKITESYRDSAGDLHMLYLWQIAELAVDVENRVQSSE